MAADTDKPSGALRWQPAQWRLAEHIPVIGQPLHTSLMSGSAPGSDVSGGLAAGTKMTLRVTYSTLPPRTNDHSAESVPAAAPQSGGQPVVSEAGSALGWLEPAQTAGRKHPYLYTQCQVRRGRVCVGACVCVCGSGGGSEWVCDGWCMLLQAIYARSLLPCQDTPAIKATYKAFVSVKEPFTALMSARRVQVQSSFLAARSFQFNQPVAVPRCAPRCCMLCGCPP